MSEMSTIDSGTTNATISTEISSETRADSPSTNISSEDNVTNHDLEQAETKDVVVNSTTNRVTVVSGESANGLTEMQIIKVLRFRLVISYSAIICFVIMLYQIPVILYYVNTPGQESDEYEYDYENCLVNFPSPNISSHLENCGLPDYPECEVDSIIIGLWSIYELATDPPCAKDASSFFCNATLVLCNGDSSSVDLIMTEECEEVRDSKCASEWRVVDNFYNISVPDCMSFNNEDGNLTSSPIPKLQCPNGFDHFCGTTCLPVCAGNNLYSGDNMYYRSIYILVAVLGVIGVIAGFVTLTAFYYYRKKVMQFPQVYIVFNAILVQLGAILEYLPIFGQSALLCSHRNALVAVNEPTNFCQAQGFLLHLIYNCFMGFWCFHLFHLTFGLMFPFKMKMLLNSSSRRKKIMMAEVGTVVLFSSMPPIVTIAISNYSLASYYCFPAPLSAVFYGHLLPLMFVFCTGVILLLISLRLLRRKHHLMSKNVTFYKVFCLGYSIPEVKLTLLFCYYAVTFFVYFCAVVAYFQEADKYNASIGKYIFCSAGGFKEECETHREKAEESIVPSTVLIIIGLLLYTLLNVVHLLYVVHIPTVLNSIRKFCSF